MPYKTIQQNFANGELNENMHGRSDTEMYYKSAAKMRDVVTTPYGGYARRAGLKHIAELFGTSSRITTWSLGTALSDGNSTLSNANDNDIGSYFHSTNTIGAINADLIKQYSESTALIKKVSIKGIGLRTEQATANATVYPATVEITGFKYNYPSAGSMCVGTSKDIEEALYANLTVIYRKTGASDVHKSVYIYSKMNYPFSYSLYYEDADYDPTYEPIGFVDPSGATVMYVNITNGGLGYKTAPNVTISGDGTGAVGTAYISAGQVTGITITGGKGYSSATIGITDPDTDFSLRCKVQGIDNTGHYVDIGRDFEINTAEEKTFYYDVHHELKAIAINAISGQPACLAGFKIAELNLYTEASQPDTTKLLPFVFNNEQNYCLSLSNKKIQIFNEDTLQDILVAGDLTSDIIKTLRWTQAADTGIIVHADLRTKKLLRGKAYDVYMSLIDCDVDKDNTDKILFRYKAFNYGGAIQPSCISFSEPFRPGGSNWSIIMKIKTEANDKDINQLFVYTPSNDGNYAPGLVVGRQSYHSTVDAGKLYIQIRTTGNMPVKRNGTILPPNTEVWLKVEYDTTTGYKVSKSSDGTTFTTDIANETTTPFFQDEMGKMEVRVNGGWLDKSELDINIANANWWPNNSSATGWTLTDYNFKTVPYYDYEQSATISPSATLSPEGDKMEGTIKFIVNGTMPTQLESFVGQIIEGNGGRLKITEQGSNYFKGNAIIPFYTGDDIAGGDWTLTTSYEAVWSNARGWPCSAIFHGGRLWFGGSKYRPQTFWGSKVGIYEDFDPRTGYDNDAIDVTLDTKTLNKITDLFSQRNLLIFTQGGEFACKTSYNEPITPENVNAPMQTANGIWEKITPIELEGQVFFIDRKGQSLMNFIYDVNQDNYASGDNAKLNNHLIINPQDMAVEKNNLAQKTNYIYIVNGDGTLCVINVLTSQGISGGFTLWRTAGNIKAICVLPDATYIAVKRSTIDGDKVYLEKLDYSLLCDNSEWQRAVNWQPVIKRFASKIVDVIKDGEFVGQYKADINGRILPEGRAISGDIEIGLPFRSYVKSNFVEIPQLGTGVGKKKRIATMTVRTLDTKELTINGERQSLGGSGIEEKTFYACSDWSETPYWEFTQSKPYKFNILAVQMGVNYQVSNDQY